MPILKLFLVVFGNNWRAIMLSLLAATTFWFFNALNKNYNTRLNYPLEFKFDKDSVVVVEPLPDQVVVDVSGGGWNLMRKTFLFSASPVLVELDNPSEIKFMTRASLLPLVTEQLSGLSLDLMVTDTLFINIEPRKKVKLKVVVDSVALPLETNYRLISSVQIRPDSIEVVGPKSMIDTLSEHYRMFFRRNIDENINDEFDIDFTTNLLKPTPDEVSIRFQVAEFQRSSVSLPIDVTNFPADSSRYLQDSVILLHYTARRRDIGNVRPEDFNITADLTMMEKADSTIMPILIAFPTNVMEIELEPDKLKVVHVE